MEKVTPLIDVHVKNNAKMVNYAGYSMPIQYPLGIIKEHLAVREHVGLFDVSHMGEIMVHGSDALSYLNYLVTSDLSKIKVGGIKYGILCSDDGTVIDDVLVYCIDSNEFMVVVNASNIDKVYAWMGDHRYGDVTLDNVSDEMAMIAIQGPKSQAVLQQLVPVLPKRFYTFMSVDMLGDIQCLVSRTGYTGEHGYELYLKPKDAVKVWHSLQELGAVCCGLGARDTLRLEAGLPLYGHELTDKTTPLDAGLGRFVALDKDFIGRDALVDISPKQCMGFEIEGRQIAREQAQIYKDGERVGVVTSGTFSPVLQRGIGIAMIEPGIELNDLYVDVRGKAIPIKMRALPFI